MKQYNVEEYVRHKLELEKTIERNKTNMDYDDSGNIDYTNMTDEAIILMWMPLCEELARKFAT